MTALPLVAAIALIVAGLRARQRAALIEATPTSNIGMATDGYCAFEGSRGYRWADDQRAAHVGAVCLVSRQG